MKTNWEGKSYDMHYANKEVQKENAELDKLIRWAMWKFLKSLTGILWKLPTLEFTNNCAGRRPAMNDRLGNTHTDYLPYNAHPVSLETQAGQMPMLHVMVVKRNFFRTKSFEIQNPNGFTFMSSWAKILGQYHATRKKKVPRDEKACCCPLLLLYIASPPLL